MIDSVSNTVTLGQNNITNFTYEAGQLTWSSDDNPTSGLLNFYMKPNSDGNGYTANFSGYLWNKGQTQPAACDFSGSLDTSYLKPWNGYYSTQIRDADGNYAPGLELIVKAGDSLANSQVFYGGESYSKLQISVTMVWIL